jgi:hypothetical protein
LARNTRSAYRQNAAAHATHPDSILEDCSNCLGLGDKSAGKMTGPTTLEIEFDSEMFVKADA